jgi:hypothetical protein
VLLYLFLSGNVVFPWRSQTYLLVDLLEILHMDLELSLLLLNVLGLAVRQVVVVILLGRRFSKLVVSNVSLAEVPCTGDVNQLEGPLQLHGVKVFIRLDVHHPILIITACLTVFFDQGLGV